MAKLAAALVCWLVACPSPAAAARLTVAPRDSMIDAAVHIRISGLKPRSTATITAQTLDRDGKAWRSKGTYVASARGVVDLASSRSVSGTYTGVRPMGLFWSMLPVGWKAPPRAAWMFPPKMANVVIAARTRGRIIARTQIVRRTTSPEVSVRDETLGEDGFIGRFCSEPSTASRPAILRFGGSEGGLPGDATCTLLASHGYPTLVLAYFGLPGLPAALSHIPLEYFERALIWLDAQPRVDPSKVAVMGTSRGGEAALILGSVYPQYVHGVIGLVPSSVVNPALGGPNPAWTLGGQALPFLQIPVERTSGPVFVLGAGKDYLWPSSTYVREIAQRMHKHRRTDVTALIYGQAGHALGLLLPNLRLGTQTGNGLELGGSPSADARARAVAWPKLLKFLAGL